MGPRTWNISLVGAVTVLSLGLIGVLPAAQAANSVQVAAGQNLESVTIDDSTGKLNKQRLRDALEDLDFNEPTDVAIYARNGEYSDDINTKTLDYAKSSHPEWISDKPEDYEKALKGAIVRMEFTLMHYPIQMRRSEALHEFEATISRIRVISPPSMDVCPPDISISYSDNSALLMPSIAALHASAMP